jgi:hypothetical protein
MPRRSKPAPPPPAAPFLILELGVTEAEHELCLELMGRLGLASHASLMATALYTLAVRETDITIRPDAFALGRRGFTSR